MCGKIRSWEKPSRYPSLVHRGWSGSRMWMSHELKREQAKFGCRDQTDCSCNLPNQGCDGQKEENRWFGVPGRRGREGKSRLTPRFMAGLGWLVLGELGPLGSRSEVWVGAG